MNMLPEGWTRAKIMEIMESWPLQLRFSTDKDEFIIELSIDAVIESITGMLSPGELSPGDIVEMLIESNPEQPEECKVVHIKKITSYLGAK